MLNKVWTRLADVFGEEGSIESVEFSPDSRYLVSGSKFDYTVIVWRTSDGAEIWRQTLPQEIERVAWSPDGKIVVSCSEDFMLRFFDAETGELLKEIKEAAGIDGLTFSHDGRYLVSGGEWVPGENGGRAGYATVYAMPEGRMITQLNLGDTINEVDFSPDDAYLLATGHNETAMVWKTSDWSLVHTLRGLDADRFHFITGRFSPDGQFVATGSQNGEIYLFDMKTGSLVHHFNQSGRKIEVLAFSPDGRFIATGGTDPFLRFFRMEDILSGERVYTALQLHAGDQAEYLDFNQRGNLMASAHQDGTIHLWVVMTDDPSVNRRRHQMVREYQDQSMQSQP